MPARPSAKPLPITDGRAARSHRTRLAIVDALLRRLEAGDLRPTTERIAAGAGVSTRSIFLHFADVDSLFSEAFDRYAERAGHGFGPISPDAPLEERIESFAKQRGRLYEAIGAGARAALLQEHFSEGLAERVREIRRRSREAIEQTFRPELEALPLEEARELLEALVPVAGFSHWDALRRNQGLSRVRAQKVLARTLAALLS